jgi:hypothetical protein
MADTAAAMVHWWSMPLSGSPVHELHGWAVWHGRLMVLAWGVLLPAGALAARFWKRWPGQRWPERLDHPGWWWAHRVLQWSGVLVMSAGAALAFLNHPAAGPDLGLPGTPGGWHGALGWALVAAGWVQVLASALRGTKGGPTDPASPHGDHYEMTPRRIAFERLHKGLGWAAVVASVGVIALGLVAADAPRWMPAVLAAWWALLLMLFVRWQREGRCLDTYQAIWGPDARHPGNRRAPVGFGVRRAGEGAQR